MRFPTRYLSLSALFIALGILFPIIFHAVNLGSVFLPMFLPIIASAYFLPLSYAIIVGAITPLISSAVTGMPPLSPPIAQIMVFECVTLVGIAGYLYGKKKMSVLLSLAFGFLASRFVLLFWVQILVPLLGLPSKIFTIAYVAKGIPGVILILIVIPFFVYRIKRSINPQKAYINER